MRTLLSTCGLACKNLCKKDAMFAFLTEFVVKKDFF